MRTLVVEDDPISNLLLTNIMKGYGDTDSILVGTDVLPAFEKAHTDGKPYDFICLDIMLPGTDGQTLLKSIRTYEYKNGIVGLDGVKIVMITALDDKTNILDAFRSQCEGYLVKPISKDKIRTQLLHIGLITE